MCSHMCLCIVVSKYIVFMYSSQITECTFMHLYITMCIYTCGICFYILLIIYLLFYYFISVLLAFSIQPPINLIIALHNLGILSSSFMSCHLGCFLNYIEGVPMYPGSLVGCFSFTICSNYLKIISSFKLVAILVLQRNSYLGTICVGCNTYRKLNISQLLCRYLFGRWLHQTSQSLQDILMMDIYLNSLVGSYCVFLLQVDVYNLTPQQEVLTQQWQICYFLSA